VKKSAFIANYFSFRGMFLISRSFFCCMGQRPEQVHSMRHRDTFFLHHATRIGKNGVPFVVTKFRTMKRGSIAREAEVYAEGASIDKSPTAKKDPRVTTFGRLLRRTHLDELPQFWALLRGQLNLVGIRPLQRQEFQDLPPRIRRIYRDMGPGLAAIAYACQPFPPSTRALYAEYERFYRQWKANPKRTYLKYAWKIFWNKIRGKAPAR
jgi:hypothetical protein